MENKNRSIDSQELISYVQIPGSERSPLPDAVKSTPVHPDEEMSVTVLVRRPSVTSFLEMRSTSPFTLAPHLSREEFAAAYSVDPSDLEKIKQFANDFGLSIKEVNAAAGTILLSGTASAFSKAFKVQLTNYEKPNFTYRGRTGPIHIPKDLADIVEAVSGLDNRPQVRPRFQIFEEMIEPHSPLTAKKSYTPPQIANLYNFPQNINCSQQCIGIIELGGGYSPAEMGQYFSSLGVTQPVLTDVSVNGATNQPTGDPSGPDGEVALDIEVAGAVAPGVRIAVYFAPNTAAGFLNAIATAVHDNVNKPSVLSISWGAPENQWTSQAMKAMDRAFQDAAALGVTIFCASGDRGSADGVNDGLVHADFPASSPNVVGCGGTKLIGSGQTITSEVVWNEGPDSSTGGGVSAVFNLPTWQTAAHVPPSANKGSYKGRGVPDVAGDADPATGYQVLVDGHQAVYGGTSAVAPLWAGLITLVNQQLGQPVGFLNPTLYNLSPSSNAFHDITTGNNVTSIKRGAYTAQKGWDPCTGLGSPNGVNLFNALKSLQNT
ncbi:S53 family peptidase [Neobacillus massiliamazoniensis]|uniref:Peptidase S8 and S53 subtilisin kexin sedolisin n=1 Tax=Neobacillus massiliamazoniensis TaxID=1499688 RepID=A0A0U1NWS6_9BACI|nr:S53 family peptidase [Neobacillus massiliamazoniensis]CRK82222.1 peptidase S8 and S53 subtilisin kexin sedolisin [Neobacillus massiliamazoniensis]